MTPAQAAAKLNRIANRLERNCVEALVRSADAGAEIGRSLSQGGYSTRELAAMGYPYAVASRGSSLAALAYIVNKQGGEFAGAWKTRPPSSSAFDGSLRTATVNDSRVAGFLAGKNRPRSRSIRRPIDSKVAEDLRPIAIVNVRRAVRKSLRGR